MLRLNPTFLEDFGALALFLIGGLLFAGLTSGIWFVLRPNKPNEEKNAPYESGEEMAMPLGTAFKPQYLVIALAFLIFEAELLIMFPWAVAYAQTGDTESLVYMLVLALVFLLMVGVGLWYIIASGYMDWPGSKIAIANAPKHWPITSKEYSDRKPAKR
jgi:NADH-quinone oxidoreductase subunit A